MTTTSTTPDRPEPDEYPQLPDFVAVEGDAYVFVAALADRTLDGRSNWLMQMFRADPTDIDDGRLVVTVTERYHVAGRENHVAFEEQFSVRVPIDVAGPRPGIEPVRRALDRWYRRTYLGDESVSADSALG